MRSAEWCIITVSCPDAEALAWGRAKGRPVERVQSAHYMRLIGKEFNYSKLLFGFTPSRAHQEHLHN